MIFTDFEPLGLSEPYVKFSKFTKFTKFIDKTREAPRNKANLAKFVDKFGQIWLKFGQILAKFTDLSLPGPNTREVIKFSKFTKFTKFMDIRAPSLG